jgi:hypothetical protein
MARSARPGRARRTVVGGRRYTARKAELKRRMLANPDAKAITAIGIVVPSTSAFARRTRWVVATALGEAPACRRNNRRRCRDVIPSVSARSSTFAPPSRNPRSIRRSARDTVAAAPRHAGVPGADSGRHRRHGRNPARSAAAAVGKNTTFLD